MKTVDQILVELAERGEEDIDESQCSRMSRIIWENIISHVNQSECGLYLQEPPSYYAQRMKFVPLRDKLFCPVAERRSDYRDINEQLTFVKLDFARGVESMSALVRAPLTKDNSFDFDWYQRFCVSEKTQEEVARYLPSLPPHLFDAKGNRGFKLVDYRTSSTRSTYVKGGGKPITELNNWLKSFGIPPITDMGVCNRLLCRLEEERQKMQIRVEFTDRDISDVYHTEGKDIGSCMSAEPRSFFEIYDELQNKGKLKMMVIYRGDEFYGRGLVWCDEDQLYADRVYCAKVNSEFPSLAIKAVRDFHEANGIEKCVYDNNCFTTCLQKVGLTIRGLKDHDYYEHVPYADSLCYFYECGMLSTSAEKGGFYVTLNTTDGMMEHIVETYNGENHNRDECTYSEWYGDYIYDGDSQETDYNGRIYDCDVCELFDGQTCHEDNAELCYDGSYVYNDEAVRITTGLHNGSFGHEDNTIELHSGDFCSTEDDVVELDDGSGTALLEDATKNEDGEWELA